jgi:Zn-finger nucleic acid-binding protein
MKCPVCLDIEMKKAVFYNTQIDFCPQCLGVWFDCDELRQAKDEKDSTLNWLDIDLWEDKTKFQIGKSVKMCPVDFVPLYEVRYGDSATLVDLCDVCKGVWLDRGEFKKIIDYLKSKKADELLYHYLRNLVQEGREIFTGPESLREEINDFLMLVHLFNDKLVVQYPYLSQLILTLPK